MVYELNAYAQNKALDGALKVSSYKNNTSYFKVELYWHNSKFKFQQVKAICPNVPTMFISADQEAGKVLCMAQVSKEVISAKGLKANEWCGQVQSLINGKG